METSREQLRDAGDEVREQESEGVPEDTGMDVNCLYQLTGDWDKAKEIAKWEDDFKVNKRKTWKDGVNLMNDKLKESGIHAAVHEIYSPP